MRYGPTISLVGTPFSISPSCGGFLMHCCQFAAGRGDGYRDWADTTSLYTARLPTGNRRTVSGRRQLGESTSRQEVRVDFGCADRKGGTVDGDSSNSTGLPVVL